MAVVKGVAEMVGAGAKVDQMAEGQAARMAGKVAHMEDKLAVEQGGAKGAKGVKLVVKVAP